ncbi:MAG: 16S rRNA (uracil(1498)-N(3))-methyltransferase [Bacteroidales bacterium]
MQVFYAPGITGDNWILDEKESKHLIRVMRLGKGSAVRLIDGKGNLYEGIIDDPDQSGCSIKVISVKNDFDKRNYRLHIAISPLKNPERFEWFTEKCVEIGIDEITPVICRNTEKEKLKTERIKSIIISAMKQSLKTWLPVLNEPVAFSEFVSSAHQGKKMIAHCNGTLNRKKINEVCSPGDDVLIMIGPEGDFSEKEISLAESKGFTAVHLGNSRLRTETAGIAACHSIYFLNQK